MNLSFGIDLSKKKNSSILNPLFILTEYLSSPKMKKNSATTKKTLTIDTKKYTLEPDADFLRTISNSGSKHSETINKVFDDKEGAELSPIMKKKKAE